MFKKLPILCCCGLIAACATTIENKTASAESSGAAPVEAAKAQPVEEEAAADVAPETTLAANEATDDGSRVICKRTAVTGSRFAKKVCKTSDEWQNLQATSRNELDRRQKAGTYGTPNPGN